MKRSFLIGALVAPLLAVPALAQDTPEPAANEQTAPAGTDQSAPAINDQTAPAAPASGDQSAPAAPGSTDQVAPAALDANDQMAPAGTDKAQAASGDPLKDAQDQTEVRGSWITGTVVISSTTGEDVGAIEDFLIDTETNTITGAVISVGGFLGIGAKSIVVEWSRLQIDYDGYQITTDLTREEADAAPAYVFREREQPPAPPPATGAEPLAPAETEPLAPAGTTTAPPAGGDTAPPAGSSSTTN